MTGVLRDDGLSPGVLLAGRYRLIDRIGLGGMAVIWRAHDETLDRLVAVKVLDLSLSSDVRLRDLVRREAWAGARLNHPDVASVHDFVHLGAFGMLVMQLVEGEPLADLIAAGPLEWSDAVRIGARVAAVLDHAHHRGVVHRDITPDNVVIHGEQVTVLDFGIAAKIGEPDDDSTGASFGTPAYVAPERLDGTPAHAATDVYALGVILYEMLSGRVPFKVRGWDDVAAEHPRPIPLRTPGAPAALEILIRRMLSRDPHERPRAAEIRSRLEGMLAPSRRRSVAAVVSVVAVLTALIALWRPWNAPQTPVNLPTQPAPSSAVPSVASTPSPSASQTGAPYIPIPPSLTPSVTPPPMTEQQARSAFYMLVNDGVAAGTIRSDVGLDLEQMVRNATQLSHLDSVRAKINDRDRERSVPESLASQLRSALDSVARAMQA